MHNTSTSSAATQGCGDANLSEIVHNFAIPSSNTHKDYSEKKRRLFGEGMTAEEKKDLYKQLKKESKLVVPNERESRNGPCGGSVGGFTGISAQPKAKTYFTKPIQKVIAAAQPSHSTKQLEEKARSIAIQHQHSHSQPGNLQTLQNLQSLQALQNLSREPLLERAIMQMVENQVAKKMCQVEQQVLDLVSKVEYLSKSMDLKLELHSQQVQNQLHMTLRQQRQAQSQCLCSTLRMKATRQDSSFLKYLEKEGEQFSNLNNFKLASSDFLLSLSNSSQQMMRDEVSEQLQELQRQAAEASGILSPNNILHQSMRVPGASLGTGSQQELSEINICQTQSLPKIEMIKRLQDRHHQSIKTPSSQGIPIQSIENRQQLQAHGSELTDELLYNSRDFQYLDYSVNSPSMSIFEAKNSDQERRNPHSDNKIEVLELRLSHLH